MADEATPAPEETQDTPEATEEAAEATPSEEPTTPAGEDYETRYSEAQKKISQQGEELAQFRQFEAALRGEYGSEAQAEALRRYQFDLAGEDTEENASPDPIDEIEELKRWRSEQEQAAKEYEQMEDERAFADSELQRLDSEFGREFNGDEVEEIMTWAETHRRDDGYPDVEAGVERLQNIYSRAEKALIKPKKNAAKPGKGTAGVEKDDLTTPAGRQKAALAAAIAAEGSAE